MLKDYTFILAAGATSTRQIRGQYVRFLSLTGAATSVRIRCTKRQADADGEQSSSNAVEYETFALGLAFGPTPFVFDAVEVSDTSGSGCTVVLGIGDTPIDDNRLVGVVSITGGLKLGGSTATVAAGAVSVLNTATLVWTGNTNGDNNGRFQNKGTVDVSIGGANTVTVANGIVVPANGGYIDGLSSAQDLYAISASSGQDCRYWQCRNA